MDTNFKVLMALMGMEIGGAETHVLELCKGLKKRGADVLVASNGGAYEKELAECGIPHIKIPLHNKKLYNVFSAYFSLKKVIKENGVKLVHAHARIPAFLCGLLSRKLGFRFVTTAHGMFVSTFPYKYLTNWGEKSLAVSQDLEEYLTGVYGMDRKNVVITVNGIDTEKFKPSSRPGPRSGEAAPGRPAEIVCVSRLDKEPAAFIYTLLDAFGLIPNARLTVVGGGDDLENLRARVSALPEEIAGRITLTGARTDVAEILPEKDIFVGISRAALEAASCGLPVVLAGPFGYIGRFDEKSLPTCERTNFTCRGCAPVTKEKLAEELDALINSPEERLELGRRGREVIMKRYSTEKMCADALAVYESVRASRRKTDVMLYGYYGSNNNGDDALLKSVVDDLREKKPGAAITVLSRKPAETGRLYGVESLYLFNFIKIINRLRDTKMLVSGGGTLLQDLTSTRSLLYYLLVIKWAKNRGARIMLYANGIGPVRLKKNRERIRETLKAVDFITLRDRQSYELLRELGAGEGIPCHITADAAFALKIPTAGVEPPVSGKYFVACLREWRTLPPRFEGHISAFCDAMCREYGLSAVFLAMQPSDDTEISRKIIAGMAENAVFLDGRRATDEILGLIAGAEFVISMRLHAIIYAAASGTPCIGLVYDPKVRAMMEIIEQPFHTPVEEADSDGLIAFGRQVMENRAAICAKIREKAGEQREKAALNVRYAVELLEKGDF
ncbi:MAG: polysaccharide pyruvyl transferase CsaB [Clostridiales bacterium]|jgi:polysaccharide pyruvyl transferase CsaB|nr:polysaccharide pyruvyl transferase CsaB [Clostridiales bacterium]